MRRSSIADIFVFPIIGVSSMIAFLIFAREASEAVINALRLSIGAVIPSIFPCMVISKFLVLIGGDRLFALIFGGAVERIFGVSRAAATPILLGAVCGFPLGASTAAELYYSGELNRDEVERIIGFAGLPSPAFVINAVGGSMFGDKRIGIVLYFILLFVSLLLGCIICRRNRREVRNNIPSKDMKKKLSIQEAAVEAIGGASIASLKLCAYMAFFSALIAVIGEIFDPDPMTAALIGGVLEFSSGCFSAAQLGTVMSLPLCALILGWSSLSVHFQIMSVCPKGISYKYFYITLLLRSLICFALVWAVK